MFPVCGSDHVMSCVRAFALHSSAELSILVPVSLMVTQGYGMSNHHDRVSAELVSNVEREGFVAGLKLAGQESNPYAADRWEHHAWNDGYGWGHDYASKLTFEL